MPGLCTSVPPAQLPNRRLWGAGTPSGGRALPFPGQSTRGRPTSFPALTCLGRDSPLPGPCRDTDVWAQAATIPTGPCLFFKSQEQVPREKKHCKFYKPADAPTRMTRGCGSFLLGGSTGWREGGPPLPTPHPALDYIPLHKCHRVSACTRPRAGCWGQR